jgi:hypothetical protein
MKPIVDKPKTKQVVKLQEHAADSLVDEIRQSMPKSKGEVGNVSNAVRAGVLLNSAKDSVKETGSGWTSWLKKHFPKHVQLARNCMRLATCCEGLNTHCPNWKASLTVSEALNFVSNEATERRAADARLRTFVALRRMHRSTSWKCVCDAFTGLVHTFVLPEPMWWESWQIASEFQDREFALRVCGQIIRDNEIPEEIVAYLRCYFGSPLADAHDFSTIARHLLLEAGVSGFDELGTAASPQNLVDNPDIVSGVGLWVCGLKSVLRSSGWIYWRDEDYDFDDEEPRLDEMCSWAEQGFRTLGLQLK